MPTATQIVKATVTPIVAKPVPKAWKANAAKVADAVTVADAVVAANVAHVPKA
jgi:hypothetical protein